MAETNPTCLASIIYYIREKYYRQAINTAVAYLKMYMNDPVLLFFKAFGILMEGRVQEAIRELQQVKDKHQVSLCSIMALICAHKQCETIDQDAVSELESSLKVSRKTAGEKALYYGAMFLWLLGRIEKAKEYIDRMLKLSNSAPEGLILKGWVVLSSEDDLQRAKAMKHFDGGVQDSRNVFGMIGKIEFFMAKQNASWALDIGNQIIVSHPDFIPALELKMNVHMALNDWEQTMEMAKRILEKDQHNLKALQMMVIIALAKDGNLMKAKEHLQALLSAVEVTEPSKPSLHVDLTLPISRLCGKNSELLQILALFVERAYARAPGDADVASELGYLMVLQDKYKEAARWYSVATKMDGNSLPALAGVIRCQLMEGEVKEAEQQLEFLREVQQSIGRSAELALLRAILASKKGAAQETVARLLRDAAELHFHHIHGHLLSVEYFQRLDPNFLFQLVNLHLSFSQTDAHILGQPLPFALVHSNMILDVVIKATPGMLACAYHLAHVKFLTGDHVAAQSYLNLCMEKESTMPEVHLLQAELHLHAEDYSKCLNCLEFSLSHNFQVRELPQYYLIKARAQRKTGELADAIKSLKMAMNLPGVRRPARGKESSVNSSERASVYLELAEALRLNGEQHEATMVMQNAILSFADTTEEIRVMVANVDLALAKDDVDTALIVLRSIAPGQPNYIQAKEKMARVYLEKRNDRKVYIACYREICEELPGPQSSMLLGDAYMKIQEPEKAIEVYQDAMKTAPKDPTFAKKIGQAFVRTHQYDKAVVHYETAVSNSIQDGLCLELVELLIKLRNFETAQKVLEKALDHEDTTVLTTMMNDVKYVRALVNVLQASDLPSEERLEQAYTLQCKIVRRLPLEQPQITDEQNVVASAICCEVARLFRLKRDLDMAKKWYTDALAFCPDDVRIILEIARLCLEHNRADYCEEYCQTILRNQERHEEATMLLADVFFRRQQHDEAIKMYTGVMRRSPDGFHVLAKFIQMLRRVGRMDDVLPFFEACESVAEPGYNYCKGLYLWHANRVSEALMHLNKARRDTEWGEEALVLMIQICLNPDKGTVGGEVFEGAPEESGGSSDWGNLMGVSTAQKLLKELRPRSRAGQDKLTLLYNLCLVHTKEPKQVERALLVFTNMASDRLDKEVYLLAMAQALMVLKQTPRARNQLKRLTKVEWSEGLADDLEASWLLLADIYVKSGKYDIANDQLRRCLRHNQSCSKAYEYMGFMMENEKSYKDAAEKYELAWRYSNRASPAIGFRLAFNYLKYKDYTQAIDVCHKVLVEHPDYPLIQSEILNRAQLCLRP